MSADDRWGSRPLIADTTAWSKIRLAGPEVQADFQEALSRGQLLSSPVVKLEFLHDAKDGNEFDTRDRVFSRLREIPVTREVGESAVSALRDLRQVPSPGYHRVMAGDALIAASAAGRAYGVLHDDGHFDKLAEVLVFQSVRLI